MKQATVPTSLLSPFNGKTIVLELGCEISFKAKQELVNYLREQQAHISYILTASVCLLLILSNLKLKLTYLDWLCFDDEEYK